MEKGKKNTKKTQKNEKDTSDIEFIEDVELSSSKGDALKKIREKLKICEKERKEYLDGWQRAKADFANARKEEEKNREAFVKFSHEDIFTQIIPVLDSFEMAFSNKEAWDKVEEGWRKGVEYIYSQLCTVLENNNCKQINPLGEQFDPYLHVSIELVEISEKKEDGNIVEVTQQGYIIGDKVLRPAQVKVGGFK